MSNVSAAVEQVRELAGWAPAVTSELHADLLDMHLLPAAMAGAFSHIGDYLAERTNLKGSMSEAVLAAAGQAGSMADDLNEALSGGVAGKGVGGHRADPPRARPAPPAEPRMRYPPEDPPDPPPGTGVREPRRPPPRGPGSGAARLPDSSPVTRWHLAA